MTEPADREAGRSSPGLRYRDVGAAVRWLCQAFGFEKLSAVTAPDGSVSYAELGYGNTIIMLGAVQGFDIDQYMAQPDDIGGAETQCCYFVVKDIDAHYARACEAGCEVVIGIKSHDNGDRLYTCRDPEGHLWTFGTYDPWAVHAPYVEPANAPLPEPPHRGAMASFRAQLVAGVSLATIISVLGAMWVYGQFASTAREASAAPALIIGPELARAIKKERRRLMFEQAARRKAERISIAAREEAARERTMRVSAQREARSLAEELADAVRAKETALSAVRNTESNESLELAQRIQNELEQERRAKAEAERIAALAQSRLSAAEAAKTAAERRAKAESERAERVAALTESRLTQTTTDKAAAERQAKEEAQRALKDVEARLSEAEAAKKAAQRAAQEAEARVAFVSERAKESTEEALADIRKKLEHEQAARVAAEAAAEQAQEELQRERRSKQAAWQTVNELKRRLAQAQGVSVSGTTLSSGTTKKAAKKYYAPAAQQQQVVPVKPEPSADQWNLYKGPAF